MILQLLVSKLAIAEYHQTSPTAADQRRINKIPVRDTENLPNFAEQYRTMANTGEKNVGPLKLAGQNWTIPNTSDLNKRYIITFLNYYYYYHTIISLPGV